MWHFCKASDTRKLERLQERGLRAVFKDNNSSYEQLLEKADLPTLLNSRLQDLCILMYKVKHKLCPAYISNIFKEPNSNYNLRQADFSIPRYETVTKSQTVSGIALPGLPAALKKKKVAAKNKVGPLGKQLFLSW